jgi:TolB-like protein/Tfp pilus assembly protein PilF
MEGKTLTYRFDDARVDLKTFTVFKAGRALPMEPKAFAVLVFLIEHRGRVVEKEEILNAIWKEAFVTQNALTRVIAHLRKALGDDPKQARYIRTVQTRGYQFVPEVRSSQAAEHETERAASPARAARVESLAVLPLENLSGDPSQEYFADAMTEELITELAKIGALRVISRTSIMRYKHARKPLPEIARELNVDAVIEGSALRSGDRVRITAQLVHGATDSHLWAESYERDFSDILGLQREVARTIAREVKIKLTPQDKARLASARRVNPEACEAYLKGVYYFCQGRDRMPATKELLTRSIGYFEEAIRADRDYALAHAGRASALRWLGAYSNPALYREAKRAAIKAIELDDTIAEAHAALGWVLFKYEWDWRGAEREYLTAIELNPNTMYHQGYALLLASLGRHEEAIERVRLAEFSDPLNLTVKAVIGMVYFFAGRFDRAVEQLQKAAELDPEITLVRWVLGWAYEQRGEYSKAIQEIKEAMRLSGSSLFGAGFLGYVHARSGNRNEAKKVLDELIEASKRKYVGPYYMTLIYSALGEKEKALDWLDRAYDECDDFLTYLKVDPRLDALRWDGRFLDLMRRIGLAE